MHITDCVMVRHAYFIYNVQFDNMRKVVAVLLLSALFTQHSNAQLLADVHQPVLTNEGYYPTAFAMHRNRPQPPNGLMIAGGCAMAVGAVADVYGLMMVMFDYDSQANNVNEDQRNKGHAFEA